MKGFFLTDNQISALISEPKQLDQSMRMLLQGMEIKYGHSRAFSQNTITFARVNEKGTWRIYLRKSKNNELDFSCGLEIIPEGMKKGFVLRRYNGKSHQHTNWLETEVGFYDFHIHQSTERY